MTITLTCSDCNYQETFGAESALDGLISAHVEGWMKLGSAAPSSDIYSPLAHLCARCFAALQFRMKPPLVTLFEGVAQI